MGQYNGNWGCTTFRIIGLLGVAALGACAQQPAQRTSNIYTINAEGAPAAAPQTDAWATSDTAVAPAPRAVPTKPLRLRQEAPLRYVVKKGDTLWDIANHFLLDPWQWPQIWIVNKQVRNPHLIYPGDVLSLIYVDGQPRLVNGDAAGGTEIGDNTVKLSPQVRVDGLGNAIPAIPVEAIRDFFAAARVVTPEEMAQAPYLVSFVDPGLINGAGSEGYIKNATPGVSRYALVRMGGAYRDPQTNKVLGYEATPVGTVEVTDDKDALARVKIVSTVREARPGDRLLPLEEESYDAYFYPKAPDHAIDGRIISVVDGVSQISQYQVVVLNRGSAQGLERGDVLTVMQTGRIVRDPVTRTSEKRLVLPDLEAGTAMVFKVTPLVSYALVTVSTRAIHKLDKVESPAVLQR